MKLTSNFVYYYEISEILANNSFGGYRYWTNNRMNDRYMQFSTRVWHEDSSGTVTLLKDRSLEGLKLSDRDFLMIKLRAKNIV